MIHNFTVTFGAKYLTGMVTSVPPTKLSVLLRIIFFISLKTTKITSKNSNFQGWSCDIQFHKYAVLINWNFL